MVFYPLSSSWYHNRLLSCKGNPADIFKCFGHGLWCFCGNPARRNLHLGHGLCEPPLNQLHRHRPLLRPYDLDH